MHTVNLVLYLAAALAFLIAAVRPQSRPWLIPVGLLAWVLIDVIATVRAG